jgi:hypothetical protein
LAKDAMASRWRLSLSLSAPTLVAELVRKYAIAGVLFFLDIVPIPSCLVTPVYARILGQMGNQLTL